jgi:molecular chaperone GrpE (heat shock protein)
MATMTSQPWELRLTKLETQYESLEKSLGAIAADLREMRATMQADFREVRDAIRTLYYFVAGSWLTIMLAIFFHK